MKSGAFIPKENFVFGGALGLGLEPALSPLSIVAKELLVEILI